MRAAVVRQFGAAENILVESGVPIPTVDDKQILVQVHSAGVNPVDTYIRSGTYAALPSLPYTPGREGAGIISKVGTNVKNLKVGDRVWFNQPITGSTAQFALTNAELTYPLSERLSFSQAATLGIAFMTAYKALFDKAGAQAGQSLLIHGISGGVGLAASQLAKAHGLRVAGTSSTQQGSKLARQNGAQDVFNHGQENYIAEIKEKFPNGFDIILEMLANVNLAKDIDLVANHGRIVVIGNRGSIEINPRALMSKEALIIGVMLGLSTTEEYQRIAERLNALIEAGHVSPYVGQHFPLEQIAQAHYAVIDQSNGARVSINSIESDDDEEKRPRHDFGSIPLLDPGKGRKNLRNPESDVTSRASSQDSSESDIIRRARRPAIMHISDSDEDADLDSEEDKLVDIFKIGKNIKRDWRICGTASKKSQFVRSGVSRRTGRPYKVFDFVVTDDSGCNIKICVWDDQLFNEVVDGKKYCIKGKPNDIKLADNVFNYTSHEYEIWVHAPYQINELEDEDNEEDVCGGTWDRKLLEIVPLDDLSARDKHYICTIAVIDKACECKEIQKKSDDFAHLHKRNLFISDPTAQGVRFTLWNQYAKEFDKNYVHKIIGIKYAKVQYFDREYYLNASRDAIIDFNPKGPLVNEMAAWVESRKPESIEERFETSFEDEEYDGIDVKEEAVLTPQKPQISSKPPAKNLDTPCTSMQRCQLETPIPNKEVKPETETGENSPEPQAAPRKEGSAQKVLELVGNYRKPNPPLLMHSLTICNLDSLNELRKERKSCGRSRCTVHPIKRSDYAKLMETGLQPGLLARINSSKFPVSIPVFRGCKEVFAVWEIEDDPNHLIEQNMISFEIPSKVTAEDLPTIVQILFQLSRFHYKTIYWDYEMNPDFVKILEDLCIQSTALNLHCKDVKSWSFAEPRELMQKGYMKVENYDYTT
ncbi:zinc-binding dehydrogenase domain-containing protein [Ditylenchus destructor]|uniref:Zinc-binding dehydrogenase domain-containing protein n=1 Tax=Ditylenchus destructor TaxID=166010 RepID=A0AAD4MUX1_9BILA|nr:zinc-binding dehydrogenase domain-containing protein [Ditylenchus destructor]